MDPKQLNIVSTLVKFRTLISFDGGLSQEFLLKNKRAKKEEHEGLNVNLEPEGEAASKREKEEHEGMNVNLEPNGVVNNKREKEEHEGMNVNLEPIGVDPKKGKAVQEADLPEDILEAIVGKLPFPSIFSVREVSKIWKLKFSSTSPEPSCFQKEVSLVSSTWASYCPVFFTIDSIIGFDRALSEWTFLRGYPNLPFLPTSISCDGALVCLRSSHMSVFTSRELYSVIILNVLTKSQRVLQVPESEFSTPLVVWLHSMGSFAYKVIVITTARNASITNHVYDSATSIWTHNTRAVAMDLGHFIHFIQSAIFMDGVWYGLSVPAYKHRQHGVRLLRFDDETGLLISELIAYGNQDVMYFLQKNKDLTHRILVCGDRIIVCFHSSSTRNYPVDKILCHYSIFPDTIHICELDLKTLQLTQIAKGPSPNLFLPVRDKKSITGRICMDGLQFSFHEGIIYCGRNPGVPVLAFDLGTSQWDYLPVAMERLCATTEDSYFTMGQCAFQPGLNPFAVV